MTSVPRCRSALATVLVSAGAVSAPDTGRTEEERLGVPVAATVSVDSSFSGYGTSVLTDGRWVERIAPGLGFGDPDRLGNGGNTWVSAESDAEHWIRLDFPAPVAVDEVEVRWSLPEWYPRAFRVEALRDGAWVPARGSPAWLAATASRSVVALEAVETSALRILQPPGGGRARRLLAAQEVRALRRPHGVRELLGARELRPSETRRLERRALEPNLARLDDPGAVRPVAWLRDGRETSAPGLADGDAGQTGLPDGDFEAVGALWPIEHAATGLDLVVAGALPDAGAIVLEAQDGEGWIPVRSGLAVRTDAVRRRLAASFVPVAARGLRVRFAGPAPPVAELEVGRYLPASGEVWPERLVAKGGLRDEALAGDDDPSFGALSLAALPMTPARALLGLRDAPHEVGAAWDGTLVGDGTLRFRFGDDGTTLADVRDTVTRRLIDGWRPGVIVEGRIDGIAVRETAFVAPCSRALENGAAFVRVEIENLDLGPARTAVVAEIEGRGPPLRFHAGALFGEGRPVLIGPASATEDPGGLRVRVSLEAGATARADFVLPIGPDVAPDEAARSELPSFDAALASFRATWDRALAPAVAVDLPDARLGRMLRAVLAQLLIDGDRDIMRYGSEPSVYREEIFGIEEGYAILALALWGFGRDAQRYLDGTYMTRDFLRKVDEYRSAADRHQQYRNGLEPHYAIELYRLGRDESWIRGHLALLRDCAEWTIAARRKTMIDARGERPLHWGLLPEWAYGGDIADVRCHALYANYACWRGLADSAWLAGELGEADIARRWAAEARDLRAAIDRAVEGTYRAAADPPFLPLRLYADRPDEQMDYYQLFAGCLLDLAPFEVGSRHGRWIADFLEADNRVFCLLPRFRRDAGAGGLDGIYGKGYLLAKLREDAVREFLLGFQAFLAFNMDRETFASRETNVLYASDVHLRSSYPVPDASDPVPCSSAVALHLLRHLLATEEPGGPGQLSGRLLLLQAAPRAWFRDGERIRVRGLPTAFGPVSFEVRCMPGGARIEAEVVPPTRSACRGIRLRLRRPGARPLRSVTVDGRPWKELDPAGEWIDLPADRGPLRVIVE